MSLDELHRGFGMDLCHSSRICFTLLPQFLCSVLQNPRRVRLWQQEHEWERGNRHEEMETDDP